MAKLVLPTSDEARLDFLGRTVVTAGHDMESGRNYISEETFNKVTEFVPVFKGRLNMISASFSNRSKETRESSEAFSALETCTRDMWEVVKRRVFRNDEPVEVLAYYELPLSGLIPKPTTFNTWYVKAQKMIDGDARAVEAGYPAMQNPSAQELKEVLEKAKAEREDIPAADRAYDEAQEGIEDLRAQANELIYDVMDDLRYFLRKMDGASQRRIMRSYGATFRYLKGEPEDEIAEEETE